MSDIRRIDDWIDDLALTPSELAAVRQADEAERAEADRIADQIMERFVGTGIITTRDAIDFAELLGRLDVGKALFRWFSTKGD